MTAPGVPDAPLDQARWIARGLLRVVRDLDPARADIVAAQLDHATEGRCTGWLTPCQDPAGEDEPVTLFEAARVLAVKAATIRKWTQRYPMIVPRIEDGVRLSDCRRFVAMTSAERMAAERGCQAESASA